MDHDERNASQSNQSSEFSFDIDRIGIVAKHCCFQIIDVIQFVVVRSMEYCQLFQFGQAWDDAAEDLFRHLFRFAKKCQTNEIGAQMQRFAVKMLAIDNFETFQLRCNVLKREIGEVAVFEFHRCHCRRQQSDQLVTIDMLTPQTSMFARCASCKVDIDVFEMKSSQLFVIARLTKMLHRQMNVFAICRVQQ
jgi:hypothetical protein